MRIVFMGTPDFALFSLKALVEAGEEVVGVVTQPDKPRGRGYTLTPPPVKVYALEQNLPVYQPATLKGEEFAALLAELEFPRPWILSARMDAAQLEHTLKLCRPNGVDFDSCVEAAPGIKSPRRLLQAMRTVRA